MPCSTPLETALSGLLNGSSSQEQQLLTVKVRTDGQRGVFATVPIRKYAGETISLDEATAREEEYKQNDEDCYILSAGDVAIDATRQFDRVGRFINHASKNLM